MNTNIKILLSILFLFFSYSKSFSQQQTEWVPRFNSPGNYNDYVTDMAIDKSGNVYLTGYVQVNDTDQNFVTIKYNTQGVEQWVKYDNGPDHREDKPTAIGVDNNGNVIIAGTSSYNYLTIKYNSLGDTLWVRRSTEGYSIADMTLDNLGNVYVTGQGYGTDSDDFVTLKYDTMGNLMWHRYYGGSGNGYDVPLSISHDSNNNIYIAGQISVTLNIPKGIVVKYNSSGTQLWAAANPVAFVFFSCLPDEEFHIYSVGHSENNNNTDINITKFDPSGDLIWNRNYNRSDSGSNRNDFYKSFTLDKLSNPIFTCVNTTSLRYDIATVKYSSGGDFMWARIFGESNSTEESNSVAVDNYQNIYVCGYTTNGLSAKYVTIKYNPDGLLDWSVIYNNNNSFTSHSAYKVLTDTLGNIYVTGISQGSGTGYDIATIKYSQLTNLNQTNYYEINDYLLFQNYPNPFNPVTHLEFGIPDLGFVSLKVYDLLGKEVKTLVYEIKPAGIYIIEFDGSNLPSGIYYYKIESGNFIQVRKMILLK